MRLNPLIFRLPKSRVVPLFILMMLGCSGTRYSSTVSGQVTLDGHPVPWGTVLFHPAPGEAPTHGKIDSRGHYRLKTQHADTVQPGEYIVTVKAFSRMPTEEMSSAEIDALLVTPESYHQRESSGLSFSVAPGDNTIDIQLTSN